MILALPLLFIQCKKEDPFREVPAEEPTFNFELYIDYWNEHGNTPQISFDEISTSPEVKIDLKKTFTGNAVPPHYSQVIIDNVRIIDELKKNYEIINIEAFEYRDDIEEWKNDVEFIMTFGPVEELDVILTLDASASMGDNFAQVKTYAASFAEKIFDAHAHARVGVVDFSDVIKDLELTENPLEVSNYINQIHQGPFTTLYEAMNTGIDKLSSSNADSKTILTFTDGTDNNSKPQFTPDFLISRLQSENNLINSFTIGLEGFGGVDKPVLEKLAVNGGVASFPKSISQLETVFNDFSKTIANAYNLTYTRNQQIVPRLEPIKLKFNIEAREK